jgi:hypothetical protein
MCLGAFFSEVVKDLHTIFGGPIEHHLILANAKAGRVETVWWGGVSLTTYHAAALVPFWKLERFLREWPSSSPGDPEFSYRQTPLYRYGRFMSAAESWWPWCEEDKVNLETEIRLEYARARAALNDMRMYVENQGADEVLREVTRTHKGFRVRVRSEVAQASLSLDAYQGAILKEFVKGLNHLHGRAGWFRVETAYAAALRDAAWNPAGSRGTNEPAEVNEGASARETAGRSGKRRRGTPPVYSEAERRAAKRKHRGGRPKGSVANVNDAKIEKLWTKARKEDPKLTKRVFFNDPSCGIDFRKMGYHTPTQVACAIERARTRRRGK